MNNQKIPLADTNAFKGLFLDYINKNSNLKAFYGNYPNLDGFKDQLSNKKTDPAVREILTQELEKQYEGILTESAVADNIRLLKKNTTFTITTGHQLNIFTGPLYFIYKIITVINLCERLKKEFLDKDFVPVYWMASEDHDYDEIKSFHLFGNKYTWETDQTGAVGRFSTGSIKEVIDALPEKAPLFEEAYLTSKNLAEATRKFVNGLFGKYGLVCVDGDSRALKNLFKDIIIDDLENHQANDLAEKTSKKLDSFGYQPQVYPRIINLFYSKNGVRQRILKEGNQFTVNETDISFSPQEIISLVDATPEVFSPNVILRPLYQEMILPNLAYIGGPAEVAYWLQLKSVFDHYTTPFPILVPRNFAMIINKGLYKRIEKLGIRTDELFKDFHDLKQEFIARNSDGEIILDDEIKQVNELFNKIKSKASLVDKSLEGFVAAEAVKTNKSLENIAKRLRKAEESKQDTEISQLENVLSKLFPAGNLQERHDNFLNFYLNNPGFIDELKSAFDPLDFSFNVISYHE